MFAVFLYNIGAYLTLTAENPRDQNVPAVWCKNTPTIEIEKYSKAYVN